MTLPPSPNPLPTTEGVTQTTTPGHTDLMLSPEDIDAYFESNPYPDGVSGEGVTQGWQPIETAPKDGTDLLLYDRDCERIFVGRYGRLRAGKEGSGWFANVHSFVEFCPVAWMPLPPPPQDKTL